MDRIETNKEFYVTYRMIRVRVPDEIFKKFKVLCVENELSAPKQMTDLIRQFVETMKDIKVK